MSGRIDPFANLSDPPTFTTKTRKDKPVEEDAIAHLRHEWRL
jgi:hypothetical protein